MSKQPRVALDPDTLKPIIEAMIFASEEPLSARALLRLLAGDREDERAEVPPLAAMMAEAAGEMEPEANAETGPGDADPEIPETAAGESGEEEPAPAGPDEPEPAAPEFPEVETAVETVGELPVETSPVEEPSVETAVEEVQTPLAEPESLPGTADHAVPENAPEALPEDALLPAVSGDTIDAPAQSASVTVAGEPDAGDDPDAPETAAGESGDGMDLEDLVEAMERAGTRSSRDERREIPDVLDQAYLRAMIDELNDEYDVSGRAFRIVEVAGGFQFATVRDYGEFVAMLSKDKARRRLSPAALETLAILAYRQPVSKPEVEAIRGVNCDQVLLSLMEKNLIAITGRSEAVGRPLLYGTTEEFLRIFGLRGIGDLPKLREIEELMEEAAYNAEPVITVDAGSDVEEIEARVGAAGHARPDQEGDGDTAGTDDVSSADAPAGPAGETGPPEEIASGDGTAGDAAGVIAEADPADTDPADTEISGDAIPAEEASGEVIPLDESPEAVAEGEIDAPADALEAEKSDDEEGPGDDESEAEVGPEAEAEPEALAGEELPESAPEPVNGLEDAGGEETSDAGDEVEHDIRTA